MERAPTLDRPYADESLAQALERSAQAFADRPAVTDGAESLRYGELLERARGLAGVLAERTRPQQPVALLFHQTTAAVVATLAAVRAGRLYAPLDPSAPPARLRELVERSRAGLVVTSEGLVELAGRLGAPSLACDGATARAPAPPMPGPATALHLFFTSGTSGTPKGVLYDQVSQLVEARGFAAAQGMEPGERAAIAPPLHFGGSRQILYGGLLAGCSLHLFDTVRDGPAALGRGLEAERIDIVHGVVSVLRAAVESLPAGTQLSLRRLSVAGEALRPADVEALVPRLPDGCEVWQAFATTETGPAAFGRADTRELRGSATLPVGPRLPYRDIRIADPDSDGYGEIVVVGTHFASGYWDDPERTAQVFDRDADDPSLRLYATGDRGRLTPEGWLEVRGRDDSRVKVRGNSVDTLEVESRLVEIDAIAQARVGLATLGAGRERLVAWVVPHAEPPPVDELREALSRVLPRAALPSAFVFLEDFPRNSRGKIDTGALPDPSVERPRLASRYAPPGDDLERRFVAIWESVLGVRPVGIDDDFRDLGGDSLDAAEIIASLDESLGEELPLSLFLEVSTIAGMVELYRRSASRSFEIAVPLSTGGSGSAWFCVHGGDGDAYMLRHLGRAFASRPCYALQVIGVDGRRAMRSVERLAARYVDEVRRVQPQGPYLLGGYSFGGAVAWAMAHRLREQGETPALVALLDSPFPVLFDAALAEYLAPSRAPSGPFGFARWMAWRAVLECYDAARRPLPSRWRTRYRLYRAGRALDRFRPEMHPGAVAYVRADRPHKPAPERRWRELASGPFEIVDVPGSHRGPASMLHLPHAGALASRLEAVIARSLEDWKPDPDGAG